MRKSRALRLPIALMICGSVVAASCGSDSSSTEATGVFSSAPASSIASEETEPTSLPSTESTPAAVDTTSASPETSQLPAEMTVGPGVDVENKTITVVSISALTGPPAIIGIPATAGERAYFESVNASGGIDGWTIELLEKDSQYNPQLHKQLYDEVKNDVAMISQSVGSPTTAAIVDSVIADDMLVLPSSFATALAKIPNMAMIGTPYQIDVINGFQWAVDEKGAGAGTATAIVYQDDEYGQDTLAGYEKAVAGFEFEDVGQFTYARTDTDFTGLVRNLQSSGATFVHLAATPSQTGPILAQAAQLGYEPTWLLSGPSFDPALLTRLGLPPEIFASTYLVTSAAAWGDDVPGMTEMLADAEKFVPEQEPSVFFLVGYVQARLAVEILRVAIANNDLSRAGLLTASASLEDVDLGGLFPVLNLTAEDRIPSRESLVFEIDPDAVSAVTRLTEYFMSPLAPDVAP